MIVALVRSAITGPQPCLHALQVKALEEQYSQHMQQLESQLEEARKQQQQAEIVAWRGTATLDPGLPDNAFTTSSAAQMTLQLLEKLLNVSVQHWATWKRDAEFTMQPAHHDFFGMTWGSLAGPRVAYSTGLC